MDFSWKLDWFQYNILILPINISPLSEFYGKSNNFAIIRNFTFSFKQARGNTSTKAHSIHKNRMQIKLTSNFDFIDNYELKLGWQFISMFNRLFSGNATKNFEEIYIHTQQNLHFIYLSNDISHSTMNIF